MLSIVILLTMTSFVFNFRVSDRIRIVKMKAISVLLICMFISACSSTKVHLYTRYLSVQEVEKVTQNLETLGFDIVANSLAFPDGIDQSTLLYSPFVEGENTINILIDSLDNAGWIIPNVKPIFAGNHYYTKNSIGLLLLPEGRVLSDKVKSQDIANEYESKECSQSMKLKLNSDGTYQFNYLTKNDGETAQLQGRWQITSYPYIELISSNKMWRFYYQVEKNIVSDVVGKAEITKLQAVDDHYTLPKCNFVYGLRI